MEHKIKFIIFQVILISLIASIQITFSASPSFQFKQVMPRSQWMSDSPDQPERIVVLDSQGGAIIVSNPLTGQLITQRIDRYGNTLWGDPNQLNEIFLRKNQNDHGFSPILLSDGTGGVYVAYAYSIFVIDEGKWWYNYDVYVQHLSSAGIRLWGEQGAAVSTHEKADYPYGIFPNEQNGVVIYYSAPPVNNQANRNIQLIEINGNILWPKGKEIISNDTSGVIRLFPLGDKTALLLGYRNYIQRISTEGEFIWPAPFISPGINLYRKWIFKTSESEILLIGNSTDYRKINAQKLVLEDGTILWGVNGRSWVPSDSTKIWPIITPNGKGGAYIFYQHFLQEVDANGNYRYERPVAILDTTQFRYPPKPVSGDYSQGLGAFVLYSSEKFGDSHESVILQRVTRDGELPWGNLGITVCDSFAIWDSNQSIIKIDPTTDEAFVFLQFKNGIFVTKIDLAHPDNVAFEKIYKTTVPDHFELAVYPNPFTHSTSIQNTSHNLFQAFSSIKIYNILGREVVDLSKNICNVSVSPILWNGRDSVNNTVSPGIYFIKVENEKMTKVRKILKLQ